jgi:translation initiation factor 6
MHIYETNFNGNPNVGLFGFANDHVCLMGYTISEKQAKKIEHVLKVPVHRISLFGTDLIGAFCAGNNKMIILPEIVFEDELKVLDRLGVKYKLIKTRHTALGNNVLCNDHGCLVNPDMGADSKKLIRQALDVPLKPGKIAETETVGSVSIHNKYGCIVHRDAKEFEIKFIKDILKMEIHTGSVNMGNPYLGSGVICNSNGFVIGDRSGGPEVVNIDECLGFLKKYSKETEVD